MTTIAAGNPLAAVAAVLGLAVGVFACLIGSKALSAKLAGWKALVLEFPTTAMERQGETYKSQSGTIGRTHFERAFALQLLDEGLGVRPSFASHSPILIPWPRIAEVVFSEFRIFGLQQKLLLIVQWEKPLQFSLPHDAVATLEKNVPPERWRRIRSASELLEQRRRAR